MRRWTLPLFVALAVLHIAPVWSVRYVPTGDGPAHIYNAWVLHELLTDDAPANIAHAYRIDWRPHPNWSGHALMALAMFVTSPLVAEKLLLTLIVALLLGGTWFLTTSVDPRNDLYAFLAFPFVWTQSLVAGYYNFSLSIGLFLIILGIWWRRRERATLGSIALIATLLLLCNFTHPMAAGLACGAIVLLSLLTLRFAHIVAILPTAVLLAMFGSTAESNTGAPMQLSIEWDAARILARIDTLYAWDDRIRPVAIALALSYAALIVFTLVREKRRESDAIAVLALALIAMMFWLPAAEGTRDLFTGRMQPFVFLILPAWFTAPRRPKAFAAIVTAIAIASGLFALDRIRLFSVELEKIVRAFDPVAPGTTFLPLFFDRPQSASYVNVFAHALGYVALEKRLVDFSNYEPTTNYFPIADRIPALGSHVIDTNPGGIDLAQPIAQAEYIATFQYPNDAPNRGALRTFYSVVKDSYGFTIHRRRHAVSGPRELILLPLIGRSDDVYGHGTRFRIEQTIRNLDSRPVRVLFRQCPADLWCDRELAPGESADIATADRAFAFIDVPRGAPLDIHTAVRRIDVDRPDTTIVIPAPREAEFTNGGTRIANVDTRDQRVGLRLYVIGPKPHNEVLLRLRDGANHIVAERRVSVENLGVYGNAELSSEIGPNRTLPETIHIEIETAPDARVWAFATALDAAGRTRVVTPERPGASGGRAHRARTRLVGPASATRLSEVTTLCRGGWANQRGPGPAAPAAGGPSSPPVCYVPRVCGERRSS